MKSWTCKFETTTGVVKVLKIRAATVSEAVDILVTEATVANLLGVWDSKKVQWI